MEEGNKLNRIVNSDLSIYLLNNKILGRPCKIEYSCLKLKPFRRLEDRPTI
jgi:hypothetical protein